MTNSFKSSNLAQPSAGSESIGHTIPLNTGISVNVDLTHSKELGKLDFVQSVYIDNADNTARLDLTFHGAPNDYRISCPPESQGWFPVCWPIGAMRFTASSSGGVAVNIVLSNFAMPYLVWTVAEGAGASAPIPNSGQYNLAVTAEQTLTVPAGANSAVVSVTGTAAYTTDGADPAIAGMPIANTSLPLSGNATLKAFKIIGAGATFSVSYFK